MMQAIHENAKRLRQEQTSAEKLLWQKLRNKQLQDLKFYRQKVFVRYIADFYCPELKLIIEIDGETHWSEEEKAYDAERNRWFLSQGFTVLRFTNLEIYHNMNAVLEKIADTVPSSEQMP
jgi:very-short-patch-repair endonuclease